MRVLPARLGLLALAMALLSALPASGQTPEPGGPADGARDPVVVDVELYVISFGDYDANRGTYTLDFYLHLSYDNTSAPPGFGASSFEFMNGRAASLDQLSDETEDGRRDLWYRIQGDLYTDPRFDTYPYDRQSILIVLEDSLHTSDQLEYRVAFGASAGLDDGFTVPGWRIDGTSARVEGKTYSFRDGSETYSRLTFQVDISRPAFAATIRTFLPPLAFVLVASFSFFLDPAQPVPRLTLGTGMLISAVAFHLSQTANLPAFSILTPFDRIMIGVYAFIASCIFVTVALAWGEKLGIPQRMMGLVNRWGTAGAFLLPLLLVALMWTL